MMVGIRVLVGWACAVSVVLGAACSPGKEKGENCDVNVVFLLRELPRYIPKNVKTIIPLTFEQIKDDKLNKYIADAIENDHHIALSSAIPQSTRKSELKAFQQFLMESKDIMDKKFGYDLKGLYNYDKMAVMSSVEKAAEDAGFEVFARSFRANLMNLDDLPYQTKQATAGGNSKHVIIQVSIKAETDVLRLDDFARELSKKGYAVSGVEEHSTASFHTSEIVPSSEEDEPAKADNPAPKPMKEEAPKSEKHRSSKKASSPKSTKQKSRNTKLAPITSSKSTTESVKRKILAHSLQDHLLASLIQA